MAILIRALLTLSLLTALSSAQRPIIEKAPTGSSDERESPAQPSAPPASAPSRPGRRPVIVPARPAPPPAAEEPRRQPQRSRPGAVAASRPGPAGAARAPVIIPAPATPAPSAPPSSSIIARLQSQPVPSGRYYWHWYGHRRFCHYYDPFGVHWYGFYDGPDFFWLRFHYGRLWWRHPGYGAWVYWDDGYWWRPTPSGVSQALPSGGGAAGGTWTSPDGSRQVQVAGQNGDAYLYDSQQPQARFMKHLASGVEKVRFSKAKTGGGLTVLLELTSGDFLIFDADGRALEAPAAAATRPEAPPPPKDSAAPPVPPPPSDNGANAN